jgi:steroid delta-isomerase-like uncharacterized protein
MSAEENKAVVRRLFEDVISKGDFALADDLVAADFVSHNLRPGQGQGREGFKQGLATIRAAFPDWQSTVEEMIAEGDKIAARWTVRGTHQGSFAGIPATGKRITMTEIGILRVGVGKVVEFWGVADELGMMQQLGIIPAGPAGT